MELNTRLSYQFVDIEQVYFYCPTWKKEVFQIIIQKC